MSESIFSFLRFVFKIDLLFPDDNEQLELRNADGNWIPPTIPQGVKQWATTGWRCWTASGISRPTSVANSDIQVSSLFYNSETDSFLGVPYDCQLRSVQQQRNRNGLGWRRLMFNHIDLHTTAVSVIGFDLEENVLASQGSPKWMPQLIPRTYNHNLMVYGDPYMPQETGLAGDLSVLLGMAALSVPRTSTEQMPTRILSVLQSSFKPPEWRPHNLGTYREHRYGAVVSIRVDQNAPTVSAQTLRKFLSGEWGAVINP